MPKKLIGKTIAWDDHVDVRRGTYVTRVGTLDDVRGRNVVIDGSYKWMPDLHLFREATEDDIEFDKKYQGQIHRLGK